MIQNQEWNYILCNYPFNTGNNCEICGVSRELGDETMDKNISNLHEEDEGENNNKPDNQNSSNSTTDFGNDKEKRKFVTNG